MSEFLSSVKADLVDRRLLPLVVLVVLALVGAVAYVVIGGGSSTTTPTAAVSTGPAGAGAPSGLAVSQITPEKAVAETTGGVSEQRQGEVHNPFTPLPEPKIKTATVAQSASSSTAGSSSSSSGSGSSQGSGGAAPTEPSKPSTPAKPKTVYHVAVLFGLIPAGTTALAAQLTPYESLKLLAPLPSASQPLIVYRGVTVGGKSATFTLIGEAILHGEAKCLPSTAQCEAIDLKPAQTEQLEYVSSTGEPLTYELRVVSIAASTASAASVKGILRGESKPGRELLSHDGLMAIPGLSSSSEPGVLVFAGHRALAASARSAARHARGR
jgi:hypothetical protein